MLALVVLLFYGSQGKVLEYRFSINFGEVFHDYSKNNNHAVNGESSLTKVSNSWPTDRGAYFDGTKTYILAPPNNKQSNPLTFSSTTSVVFWAFV